VIKKNFLLKNSFQSLKIKKIISKKLSKDFDRHMKEIKNDIENPMATLNVLNKNYNFNFKTNDLKKFQKFKTITVIGMGGSILGAEAIFNFLTEKIKKKIYFLNDINEKKIIELNIKKNFQKILFIVISKSGNTIETLSNSITLKIFKKNLRNVIIISEKKDNYLHLMAKKNNLFYIEHKNNIGGRYSVLSEVGLVPVYLMGIDIFKLRGKTLSFLKGSHKKFLKESAINLANIITSKKFNNLIFLNYSPSLEKFLFWCQQLIAESLGKEKKGFFPVISNVPKDHHSLLQLYLDGPRDKIFHIFSLEEDSKTKINAKAFFNQKHFLNDKSLQTVKYAQKDALIKVLNEKKIPFREFKIKKKNEEILGELFAYFMLETVIIGKLLRINPFDQPAVEQVKIYTEKFLSQQIQK